MNHDQNFKHLILDYLRPSLDFFAQPEAKVIPEDARVLPVVPAFQPAGTGNAPKDAASIKRPELIPCKTQHTSLSLQPKDTLQPAHPLTRHPLNKLPARKQRILLPVQSNPAGTGKRWGRV